MTIAILLAISAGFLWCLEGITMDIASQKNAIGLFIL